jgi:CheY-like chemotaxis protein
MPISISSSSQRSVVFEKAGDSLPKGGSEAFSTHNKLDYSRLAARSGHTTIILVEDNPADILLLREALASHQVKSAIFIAHDGDEAIRFLDEIDRTPLPCPDMIILDLNLPRKSGFEVLQRVRSSAKCSKKPVVILSSSEAARDREQAARLGASCYIRKPSSLDDFMAIGGQLKAMLPAGLA